ncbi:nucleotidyltransferase family protein [Streptomyces spongiae]|uniref:Nucleotidyltransferase family protein n=1 Tax=Streptomyces spongiae TaxID=565072 RepID=A0A5N8X8T7_9ACTN|nr:nucleotidyltransferase family protein [Streptomyces spongiae]MPY55843.1 nucleotidyltransferase family protein [Streptomyces spongiae]
MAIPTVSAAHPAERCSIFRTEACTSEPRCRCHTFNWQAPIESFLSPHRRSGSPVLTEPDLGERIALLRSTLHAYPLPVAEGSVADRLFNALVDRLGIDRVFAFLRHRGVAHAALAAFGRHGQVSAPDGPFAIYHRVSQVMDRTHRREVARIAKAFRAAELPLVAFKGVTMNAALGRTLTPAYSGDVDVLVRSHDLTRARDAMQDLGYGTALRLRAGRAHKMPPSVLEATENSVYSFGQLTPLDRLVPAAELEDQSTRVLALFPAFFCRISGKLHMRLSVDLHYSLNHLSDDIGTRVKPSEEVWLEDVQTVDIEGTEVVTLSPKTLSWVLPHRLYVDTALLQDSSLKTLCHLKLLWHHGRFDGEYVRHVAQRYPYLAPSLYYALRAMDQLCGTQAQPLLDPDSIRTSRAPLMNVGDCLPTWLGCTVEVTLGALEDSEAVESSVTTTVV